MVSQNRSADKGESAQSEKKPFLMFDYGPLDVWYRILGPNVMAVYQCIARYINRGPADSRRGYSWPSQEQIVEYVGGKKNGLGIRQVQFCLRTLGMDGLGDNYLVAVVRRGRNNFYKLKYPLPMPTGVVEVTPPGEFAKKPEQRKTMTFTPTGATIAPFQDVELVSIGASIAPIPDNTRNGCASIGAIDAHQIPNKVKQINNEKEKAKPSSSLEPKKTQDHSGEGPVNAAQIVAHHAKLTARPAGAGAVEIVQQLLAESQLTPFLLSRCTDRYVESYGGPPKFIIGAKSFFSNIGKDGEQQIEPFRQYLWNDTDQFNADYERQHAEQEKRELELDVIRPPSEANLAKMRRPKFANDDDFQAALREAEKKDAEWEESRAENMVEYKSRRGRYATDDKYRAALFEAQQQDAARRRTAENVASSKATIELMQNTDYSGCKSGFWN